MGDRRGRERFEIIGTFTGTLETVRRFEIRNIGAGGALVTTTVPVAPGSRISGRLSLRGHGREVRGEVRHITTLTDRDEGLFYLVGVQWDASAPVADLLNVEPMRPVQSNFRQGLDRRATTRFTPGADAEIGQPNWCTVELIDISTTGVLFASPMGLDVGEKGKLRVRLGDRSFAAQIEVRRSDARKSTQTSHRLGAMFVSLDDGNRLHLEDFIGDARR
ncbi:MAG TPA: PilZ domain-containing protein [Vicinamibacterales bacterium]|nr:PilZ domain-containing protein [Vicinamibacterales bacterium]